MSDTSKERQRVLITGSNGLLGQHLLKEFNSDDYELLATSYGPNRLDSLEHSYKSLDLKNSEEVFQVVESFMPDVVINAGAYTNVDGCEDEPEQCNRVNHLAVDYFIDSFNKLAIHPHFIQISTDFIFDGQKKVYSETDQANPISVYGETKWKGEEALLNSDYSNFTIIRTSLVYGVGEALVKGNIFSWAMNKLRNGDSLTIVDDQFRSPTYVKDLARACRKIETSALRGVINIAGPETHSMYDYIQKVAKYANVDTSNVTPIKTSELSQKADRPEGSGLSIEKATKLIGFNPTSFEESLADLDPES